MTPLEGDGHPPHWDYLDLSDLQLLQSKGRAARGTWRMALHWEMVDVGKVTQLSQNHHDTNQKKTSETSSDFEEG